MSRQLTAKSAASLAATLRECEKWNADLVKDRRYMRDHTHDKRLKESYETMRIFYSRFVSACRRAARIVEGGAERPSEMNMTIAEFCDRYDACAPGRAWALSTGAADMEELWKRDDLKPEWRVWIATRSGVMLDSDRRLFACWCVRRVWSLLTDERSRNVVVVAERYAEGKATNKELDAAWAMARAATREETRDAAWAATRAAAGDAAWDAAGDAAWDAAWAAAGAAAWAAIRDMTWDATREETRDAAWAAAGAAAWAAIRDMTWDATRDAVWAATRDAAWAVQSKYLIEHANPNFVAQP